MAHLPSRPQHTAQRFNVKSFNPSTPQAKLSNICLRMFCDSEKLAVLLDDGQQSDIALQACGSPIIKLLLHLSNAIKNREGNFDLVVQRLDDLINLATEKFYAFPFKDVPACWERSLPSGKLFEGFRAGCQTDVDARRRQFESQSQLQGSTSELATNG